MANAKTRGAMRSRAMLAKAQPVRMALVRMSITKAIKEQDFEGAASMRDKEKHAKEKQESVLAAWKSSREEKRVKVDEEDILHVVSKWTGIPLKRMEQGETQRLLAMED